MANRPQYGSERESRLTEGPPFSIQLLCGEDEQTANASRNDRALLISLLPASYRTESGDLAAASKNVIACLALELDLRRLTSIHIWLWIAGLPMPPRPLHHQLLLGREIFVTERMDMHLVWATGRMFLKPIPRFLLEPAFWAEYLRWLGCMTGTRVEM